MNNEKMKGTLTLKHTKNATTTALKVEVERKPIHSANQLRASIRATEAPKAKNAEKKELNNLASILDSIFHPLQRKDGVFMQASISHIELSAMKRLGSGQESGIPLSAKQIELYSEFVGKSDTQFKTLLKVVLATQALESKTRGQLLDFCAQAISRNWIASHRQENNIFISLAEPIGFDNSEILANLTMKVDVEYERRIENLKKRIKEQNNLGGASEKSIRSQKPEQLISQRENLLSICYLWATEKGKCEPKKAIAAFEKRLLKNVNNSDSLRSVYYFLASQQMDNKKGAADTVLYYDDLLCKANERRRVSEDKALATQNQLLREKDINGELHKKNAQYQEEIESLKAQLSHATYESNEQQLDQQAQRVHLRDDASKAKSKAYNLLTEEVDGPLKLSLKALLRESPKVEVAAHQIELAIESINRELKWFKK